MTLLRQIGRDAKPVVPDLVELLKDRYGPAYYNAAEVIKTIDPDAAKKAGVR